MMNRLVAGIVIVLALAVPAVPAVAEDASYGAIDLTGLARNSWGLNPEGEDNAMVCNVNGPDGYLTIRAEPSSKSAPMRKLNRLAIVVVDTRVRDGNWVRVITAYRTHNKHGERQALKNLPVSGWAHDGYLCDFLD